MNCFFFSFKLHPQNFLRTILLLQNSSPISPELFSDLYSRQFSDSTQLFTALTTIYMGLKKFLSIK